MSNIAAMQNDVERMKAKAKETVEKARLGAEGTMQRLNDGVKSFTDSFNNTKITPFSGVGGKRKKKRRPKSKRKKQRKSKKRKTKSKRRKQRITKKQRRKRRSKRKRRTKRKSKNKEQNHNIK